MRFPLAAATLVLGLAAPSPALATEFFASPDETRTTQSCLSEAEACALSKALDAVPFVFSGNPFGVHTVTLLPGRYDGVDLDPGATFNQLRVDFGLTIQGKPGADRPVLAFGDPGSDRASIELRSGGALRSLRVEAAALGGISARGLSASASGRGDVPAVVERVQILSTPRQGDDTSYGLSLQELSSAINVDVDQRAAKGAALSVAYDDPSLPAPRIVGVTATSTAATALEVLGGQLASADTLRVRVANTVLRGTPDLLAQSDFFTTSPPPGSPNPVEVTLANSAVRDGASRTLLGPGVVTVVETGTVKAADLALGADRVPTAGSPLVNAGLADPDLGTLDLLGNARTVGPLPDIGAYEFAVAPSPAPTPTPAPGGGSTPTPTPTPAAPTLAFTGKSATLKRSKLSTGKGVSVALTTSAALKGGTLELVTRTKRKGKTTEKVLANATLGATPAGAFTVRLKGKASKLGKGSVKAFLRLRATSAVGTQGATERAVTIK